MNWKPFYIPVLAVVTLLGTSTTSLADRKVKVYRDLDGDGHYNKKTYRVGSHRHGGHYYGNRGYYGHRHYRPYGYRYGYSPYYYGYGYPRTSFGVSLYTRPSYTTTRVYRGYTVDSNNSLAAEVQSALRREGYYRGSIDGAIGPASRSAIRAYQRDHGLSATGRIDSRLLRSLRVD